MASECYPSSRSQDLGVGSNTGRLAQQHPSLHWAIVSNKDLQCGDADTEAQCAVSREGLCVLLLHAGAV
jgi:hypothetical protein